MAEFITGENLNEELILMVRDADRFLYLFSPYIKLGKRFKDQVLLKKDNPDLEIVIVFGKNEDDRTKSINADDVEFFKSFPNIKVYHKDNLHAKFYVTEDRAIITSMNLYDYSQAHNIEAGIVLYPVSQLKRIVVDNVAPYNDALGYFKEVLRQSKLLYHKQPKFENRLLGLSSDYKGSVVQLDELETPKPKTAATRQPVQKGYCIRTGVEIAFNIERPMSYEAYKKWAQFSNPDYPEKFCHKTGKASNGQTCMRKPVL